ncbi:hypothetical protein BMW24_003765 [Mycobacterium heckeshornense]|uniref:Low molecular weight antigen MTB12-like C-terminal domain-containing protein n=1 Tax=Mycobacterium heckeshornense TaxID=110505 RepID=A0A2G8BGE3_9MYCO|nr:hypothetical protein [Mycobacterium heckeshornense]KMV23383.1 Low molecular weight antigen MTB12 [Mycobacterium heckeshornense]MCV7032773.1 hypothetical protein [Mycobacterium heckeshornense]PIJ36837.1 hypothetical protein BMW24_003765 [Mycobacterium heckeshornense]BCO35410.1 hypothetical protein MHEC_18430 [Mycobacterium heckeshornense]BCQ08565.1 low molecular weight antigen MTB12 [Mycobacterium heckeshornense]
MTVKFLATGAATVAAITAASAGLTCIAHPAWSQPLPVVVSAPLPLDPPPAPSLPSAEQLADLCNQVTNPGVGYGAKNNLVEGGISPSEGHDADHKLREAYRHGYFPENFSVANIQQAGPNVTADVTTSGPKLAVPVTQNYTFANQGGNWVISHDSAVALLQTATAGVD